ncbi:type II toxin-antitoxin system HicB family antitoxin [Candidatus Poribacteria bacterium]|nr:type II toxin-antitoxin system HicB family antitoxin [Candidatus Poribacteria bacterium]
MKTYAFKVVLEKDKWPDESDEEAVWRAYIPALEYRGAASWGYTEKEALENLKNAVDLLVEYLLEIGEAIPSEPRSQIQVSDVPLIAVTV